MMTPTASDHHFDLGVKGHGQTYLKSVLQLVIQSPLSFFEQERSYMIIYNVCIWSVDYDEGFRSLI